MALFNFKLYGRSLLNPYDSPPDIILTRQEAIASGLNPDDKKGYYTKINGMRHRITIKNSKGE